MITLHYLGWAQRCGTSYNCIELSLRHWTGHYLVIALVWLTNSDQQGTETLFLSLSLSPFFLVSGAQVPGGSRLWGTVGWPGQLPLPHGGALRGGDLRVARGGQGGCLRGGERGKQQQLPEVSQDEWSLSQFSTCSFNFAKKRILVYVYCNCVLSALPQRQSRRHRLGPGADGGRPARLPVRPGHLLLGDACQVPLRGKVRLTRRRRKRKSPRVVVVQYSRRFDFTFA